MGDLGGGSEVGYTATATFSVANTHIEIGILRYCYHADFEADEDGLKLFRLLPRKSRILRYTVDDKDVSNLVIAEALTMVELNLREPHDSRRRRHNSKPIIHKILMYLTTRMSQSYLSCST